MKVVYKVLYPFLIVLFFSLFLFTFNKGDVVLTVNRYHTLILDVFFKSLSSIGNTMSVFFFLGVVLMKYKLKFLYFFLLAFVIESSVVIICKQFIFNGVPRPYSFFEAKGVLSQLNLTEGLRINKRNSFPSGHTAYAFVVATYFALKIKKILPAIGLCFFATFIGLSRIYLVQHFFMDVFAGAVVGILSAYLAILWIKKSPKKKWYGMKLRLTPTQKYWFEFIPEN